MTTSAEIILFMIDIFVEVLRFSCLKITAQEMPKFSQELFIVLSF